MAKMAPAMERALIRYGRTIKKSGWRAGEPLIEKYNKIFPEFKKWAYALGILLRVTELLDRDKKKK